MKKHSCLKCAQVMIGMYEAMWLHAVEVATAYEAAFFTGNTLGLKLLGLPTRPFKRKDNKNSSLKRSKVEL